MRDKSKPEEKKQTSMQTLLAWLKSYFRDEEFADLQQELTESNKEILRKFRDAE